MGWNRLKLILGAVLLCANIVLAVCTGVLVRDAGYVSEKALLRMEEMLRADAITILDGAVERRKPSLVLYGGTAGDSYYTEMAARLSGSETEHSFATPSGLVLTMQSGDRFVFSDGFGVFFEKKDAPEFLTVDAMDASSLTEVSGGAARAAKRTVERFLAPLLQNADTQSPLPSYTVEHVYEGTTGGICYVVCTQNVGGTAVADYRACFAIREDTVVGLSGKWCMAEMQSSFSAQLIDQINILYSVREVLLEERDGTAEPLCRIDRLTLAYAPYFRADTDDFYLIPAWKVQMNDGKIYMINAVDGSLYTN